MIELLPIAFALLGVAGIIGALDGFYFHLWSLRLFARQGSKLEHAVHTMRALLLPLTLWFGFAADRTTASLLVFGAVELADLAMVIWDVSIEHASRRDLGGLSRAEYLVHVVATTIHSGAIALAFASWPAAAWRFQATNVRSPDWLTGAATAATFGAVFVAVLHVVLMHPRFTTMPATPT
jgi:hypothetical protein